MEGNKKTIAVSGASGTVGSELVRILSARGVNVLALSRNPEKGEKLPNVKWVAADLSDKEEYAKAIKGADALFLVTGNIPDMVWFQRNGIKAAQVAGVEKVVKLSALGASEYSRSLIGLWHAIVEKSLVESGLKWVLIRPHAFMQNWLNQKEEIAAGVIRSAAGDGKVPFIDSRDISTVAAEALLKDDWNGKKPVLTGPEGLSFDEVAEIFSKELDKKITHIRETEDETYQRLRKGGMPIWLVAGQLALYNYWRKGGTTAQLSDEVEKITGKKPYTVADFVRSYKEHFKS